MWAPSKPLSKLSIEDESAILDQLEDLRQSKTGINWVLMGYTAQGGVHLIGTGKGGFEEVKSHFVDDEVRYAVVEVMVQGDTYNPVKYVMITWIGPKVSPGLGKARCAGHRPELLDFFQQKIGIAGEFQPAFKNDLTSQDLASKLTRIARQDTAAVDSTRHQMSRAHQTQGDRSKSQVKLVDEERIAAAMQKVQKGEDGWAALVYVEGKKDEITYLQSGQGLEDLKRIFPQDKIVYALFTQKVKETTNVTTKFLLITMVGAQTGPLVKARSGPHRSELVDYIKQFVTFHSHYQAAGTDDLEEFKILQKLRA